MSRANRIPRLPDDSWRSGRFRRGAFVVGMVARMIVIAAVSALVYSGASLMVGLASAMFDSGKSVLEIAG